MIPIIIPFRNDEKNERLGNLKFLINNFKKSFKNKEFIIFIINQNNNLLFNKSTLLNIGIKLMTDYNENLDYFILHDVDQILLNNYNLYSIKNNSCLIKQQGEKYYDSTSNYYGGVISITKKDFIKINGFSNYFWGWGWEDGAIRERLKYNNISYSRGDGVFSELNHETKHRYLGNTNFINNAIVYNFLNINSDDGLSNLNFNNISNNIIDNNKNIIFFNVETQNYQYNIDSIIDIEYIKKLNKNNFDLEKYDNILKTYRK